MIPYIFKFLFRPGTNSTWLSRRYKLIPGELYQCELSKMCHEDGRMISFRFKTKRVDISSSKPKFKFYGESVIELV